jgi:biopolymer transport protein ExbD
VSRVTIRFDCPSCGKTYRVADHLGGRTVTCAGCRAKLTVPEALPRSIPEAPPIVAEPEPEGEPPPVEPPLKVTRRDMMPQDLVDMTAMVDIVFFLLIFFLVTSISGVASSISMPPPNPQKPGAQARKSLKDYESDHVVVKIDRDNTIFLDEEAIPSEQELRVRLKDAKRSASSPLKLLVLGSGEAHHGTVVMVLDAGYDAGLEDISLAVKD